MSRESGDISFQELKELDAHFDAQLDSYSGDNKTTGKDRSDSGKEFYLRRWIGRVFAVALLALLPFFLLIRVSLLGYSHYGMNGWAALLAGIIATILVLLLYGVYLSVKFRGKARIHRYMVRGIAGLVVAYCAYGLIYLSSYHVKSEEIRSYYRTLHPILRVTVTTASLADSDLLVTDLRRTPGDYRDMGLDPRQQSLHFEQPTGYVHAVDLRTVGKAEWKNWLTRQALHLLGFRTLRHVGTADHLHVALPLND